MMRRSGLHNYFVEAVVAAVSAANPISRARGHVRYQGIIAFARHFSEQLRLTPIDLSLLYKCLSIDGTFAMENLFIQPREGQYARPAIWRNDAKPARRCSGSEGSFSYTCCRTQRNAAMSLKFFMHLVTL